MNMAQLELLQNGSTEKDSPSTSAYPLEDRKYCFVLRMERHVYILDALDEGSLNAWTTSIKTNMSYGPSQPLAKEKRQGENIMRCTHPSTFRIHSIAI